MRKDQIKTKWIYSQSKYHSGPENLKKFRPKKHKTKNIVKSNKINCFEYFPFKSNM